MTRRKQVLLAPVVAAVVLLIAYAVAPAFEGYHLGCNTSAGDNITLTRAGLQWCKRGITEAMRQEEAAKQAQRFKEEEERATERKGEAEERAREPGEARKFEAEHRANAAKAKREQQEQARREPGEVLRSEGR